MTRNRKKRIWLVAACLFVLLTGCSGGGGGETAASVESAGQETAAEAEKPSEGKIEEAYAGVKKEPYDALEYVKLGTYKGIQVSRALIMVDDQTLESVLSSQLAQSAYQKEVTGRPVQEGDMVNIDYKGMKDGVAFEGGTAQGYNLVIGSGSFIEGFEDGLIGATAGQKLDLKLTFPDPYKPNPDLAGQPVVFEVTVNQITETVIPELTDEYAVENSDYATAEEFREGLRNLLQEENKKSAVLDALMAQAEFLQPLPENLTEYYKSELIRQTSYQAVSYGMDLETLLEVYGMTAEQFLESSADEIENNVRRDIVIEALIAAEKLELTGEEFDAGVAELAKNYGKTEEEVVRLLGEDLLRENFLWNKAVGLIAENAVETE